MGIKKSAITRWLMAVVIIWPFSCSMIQPAVKKNMPSPTPGSRTIEPIPESQPQQAFPQEGPSLSTPQVKHFTHEIKWRGETLGSIARWYTGSAKNWIHLAEANPGIDPRSINIGDSVLIPDYLLKTRELMPIDFLPSTIDKIKDTSLASKQPIGSASENIARPAPVHPTFKQVPVGSPQLAPTQKAPQPSTPKVKYFTHEIKWRGETLGSIARWYTGLAKNWVHLVQANPGIDPRSINIGDSVLIPDYLLKTRRPMPNDFLLSSTDKRKKPSTISTKQTDRSDKLELFGPINTESQTAGEIELFRPIDTESQTAGGIELFGPIAAESQTAGADDSDSAIPLETIE